MIASPDKHKESQKRDEIVSLVIQQVVDYSVIPSLQITNIWERETSRAQDKIVQGS